MKDIKKIIYEEYINIPIKERKSYAILEKFNKQEKMFEKKLSKEQWQFYETIVGMYCDYWCECQMELLNFCFDFIKNILKLF